MAAIDFVSDSQFDKSAPDQESPPRPTMNGEHLGEQFTGLTGKPETPKAARHPNYVGERSLHDYRTSPGSAQ